jgi:hypothetical protein
LLTPKQGDILKYVEKYGKHGISAMDIGIAFGYPRKKAGKWAKPALNQLTKQKLIERRDGLYFSKQN